MKNRITAILLAAALLCALLPQTVLLASAETYSGTCGDNATWTFDTSSGKLTISGYGEMDSWMSPTSFFPWSPYSDIIRTVIIENGITNIGDYAFYNCTGLTSVTIPNSVTDIGYAAFENCSALKTITLPSNVKHIDGSAFYNCFALRSIIIPKNVTAIEREAFYGCTALTDISLPDSLEKLGDGAFLDCTRLTSIAIPEKVTNIESNTFYGCSGLKNISLGSNVQSIGFGAFQGCASLEKINLPDHMIRIDSAAFSGCAKLSAITIPDGLTTIYEWTFCNCSALTSIVIPESVTSIGESAFDGCTNLAVITIPDSVYHIGTLAFSRCEKLADVYYTASEADWQYILIGNNNDCLLNAKRHYYASPRGYTDIFSTQWFYNAADFNIERGLMGSTSTTALTFEPNTRLSRAMVAAIMYNLAGNPSGVSYKASFSDVPNNKWYTTAIEWAAQNKLASGNNGKFMPNNDVTRQELAVFFFQLTDYFGKNTGNKASLNGFADEASVPSWSKGYLEWAVAAKLISGKANGNKLLLDPAGKATRAEGATIIMNFVNNILGGSACKHSYSKSVTAPTCTIGGYTVYTCTKCGDSYRADETPALGHNFVNGICTRCGALDGSCMHVYSSSTTESTCLSGGYTTYTCTKCGYSYSVENGSALGHSFENRTCTRCGLSVDLCDHYSGGTLIKQKTYEGASLTKAEIAQLFLDIYEAATNTTYVAGSNAAQFPDVSAGSPYYRAIDFCVTAEIIPGIISRGYFGSNIPLTRAEFACLLKSFYVSILGADYNTQPTPYSDAEKNTWYYNHVEWCFAHSAFIQFLPSGNLFYPYNELTSITVSQMRCSECGGRYFVIQVAAPQPNQ